MNFKSLSTTLLGLVSLINITIGQTISGEIFVNNYNSPAIGAAIMIKGTNRGVLTDVEGRFTLKVNSADSILEISYTDYYSVELNLDTIEYVNISLENTPIQLVDASIKSYYTIREEDKVGGVWNSTMIRIEKTWEIDTNSSLYNHFIEKIDYPLIASENGIGGKVYVQFKVDTLGIIGDIEILNKNDIYLDPSLSNVILKSFDGIPAWTKIEREKYGGIGGYFAEGKYWTGIYRFRVEFKLIEE